MFQDVRASSWSGGTFLKILLGVIIGLAFSRQAIASDEYVDGEIIVKLKGHSQSLKSQAFVGKAVTQDSLELKSSFGELNIYHFALKPGLSVEDAVSQFQNDPEVEYAEPNYILRRPDLDADVAQAVSMEQVYSVSASGSAAYSQTGAQIQAVEAWSRVSSNATNSIIVAVIDTGIDFSHPVFVNSKAIWTNEGEIPGNGIDDDGNGLVDDVHGWNFVGNNATPSDDDGHGTHVSGIVLGSTQDITANPIEPAKIKIMPLKFLDSSGAGTTSDAVKAIYYAVDKGARVLNNSWGGGNHSNALVDAINYAYQKRAVFVAAAGNNGANNDSIPTYPANYGSPNVVSVAATSDSDGLASFSNFGLRSVHLGAPGVYIWSTLPNGLYGRASGTSMAAPFVSGVAALMLRENLLLSAYQIRDLLVRGAQAVTSLQSKAISGSRLNVLNSVSLAKGTEGDSGQPNYNKTADYGREPASQSASASSVGGMAGCGIIKPNKDGQFPPGATFVGIAVAIVLPLLIALALRLNLSGPQRRRYHRYRIDSEVRLSVGGRELLGKVSSISMGGVQLQTDAWLEHGGVVEMKIKSPDGREEVTVAGEIVWSEERKRYGVQFLEGKGIVGAALSRWVG